MRRGIGISYGMLTSFIIHNKRFGTEVGGFIQSFSILGRHRITGTEEFSTENTLGGNFVLPSGRR